jgi:hypothetical protein
MAQFLLHERKHNNTQKLRVVQKQGPCKSNSLSLRGAKVQLKRLTLGSKAANIRQSVKRQ